MVSINNKSKEKKKKSSFRSVSFPAAYPGPGRGGNSLRGDFQLK